MQNFFVTKPTLVRAQAHAARSAHDSRRLVRALLTFAGISQSEAARSLGIDPRTMRRYVALKDPMVMPYATMIALEVLVEHSRREMHSA